MNRVCLECGKLFKSKNYNAKYCSESCGYLFRKGTGISIREGRIKLICKVCKKPYYVMNSIKDKSNYCSKKCSAIGISLKDRLRKKVECVCKFCGKKFFAYSSHKLLRKYCSRECYDRKRERDRIERFRVK